ncbi:MULTISPECIES: hypothetical protein [Streptomyces]|uniref:Uncharacterized protein n=1 Tax=Streptomyces canarius TaxID=285453 RepID=A0ABQ3DIW8_9ACTN|nr:hypothetical protein [Streptomyces canarius]GHA77311.1 hypothetical protein GCM10010345_93790 [Streptomyces canarius]
MPPPYSRWPVGDVVKAAGIPDRDSGFALDLLAPGMETMAERGGSRRQLLK